ncbi:hypothetical protein KM043_012946 [Ampulex compressa]|nr:hypothetical protein KM043_012946 [Ampulex compressa]
MRIVDLRKRLDSSRLCKVDIDSNSRYVVPSTDSGGCFRWMHLVTVLEGQALFRVSVIIDVDELSGHFRVQGFDSEMNGDLEPRCGNDEP